MKRDFLKKNLVQNFSSNMGPVKRENFQKKSKGKSYYTETMASNGILPFLHEVNNLEVDTEFSAYNL